MSSSSDKRVKAGVRIINVEGIGATNIPYLIIEGYVANEIVKSDLAVNVYAANKTIYIDGEYTAVEIYSLSGAHIGSYGNDIRSIDMSAYNNGMYMVRIINGSEYTTKKIQL